MEFLTAHGPALLFYFFAAVAVLGALGVVTQRNPMYGAFALLVSFLAVAALFLLRHAEFVAVVQVFVYAGGIMVLFLFVIMLINLHQLQETAMFGVNARLAVLITLLLVGVFVTLFLGAELGGAAGSPEAFTSVGGEVVGNTEAVAWSLYRDYLLPFEIVSVFLLVAMIGAVVLGRKD